MSSSTPPPPPTSNNAAYLGVAALLGVAIVGLIAFKSCGAKTADPITVTNPGPPSSALNPSQVRATNDVPPPPEDIDAAVEVDAGKAVSAMASAGCDMKVCKGNATSEVQGALQQRARQTRRSCYESALAQDESLKGHVEINVRVGTNGQVCSASVASTDMGSPGVGQCVANMFRSSHMPSPSGGCVDVKVPISFVPGH